jgi:hypothetical protein
MSRPISTLQEYINIIPAGGHSGSPRGEGNRAGHRRLDREGPADVGMALVRRSPE